MFYKAVLFAFVADLYLNLNSAVPFGRELTKRSDVDLQTCINNFAVHKDKIIRTQDSRAMGAKYLNEIDLDTREECLRLCCETENCDVFIYEEKSVGSCYLFQCGPPEDFKCKFTHHVNYSSGVLTVNRHLPDLESQIKLTKHEQDLTKLRKPEVQASGNSEVALARTTPSTISTTTKAKEVLDMATNTKSPPETGKCSRFQFECRSNSECIAIYNACDGIPQCTDGSDEAPELGCPALTTAPPSHNHPVLPMDVNFNQMDSQSSHVVQPQNVQNSNIFRPPVQHQGPQQNTPRQELDFLRPIPEPRNPLMPQNSQYEAPQVPQYQQYVPQQNSWPHQSNQLPPQIPQYAAKNSHIFNHKENGLQVPDGQETRYNKYKGAMQTLHRALGYSNRGQIQYGDINNHEYPKVPNYYSDVYRQPVQQMQENWQNHIQENYHNSPYVPEINPNPRENWQPNISPAQKEHEQNFKPNQDLAENWKSDEENPTHVQNKMVHELQHSKEHFESKGTETKQIKIEKHVHPTHDHDHSKYLVAEIAERIELQDGVSETPGGAILSLTLGLILTCLMAILIGCRLRVVRRRMRRGGKSTI